MAYDRISVAARQLRAAADELERLAQDVSYEPTEKIVEVVVGLLSRLANIMTLSHDDVAEHIVAKVSRDHRTLQQCMIGMLTGVLVRYADAPSDARNDAAVRMCRDIRQKLVDEMWVIERRVVLPHV